MNEKVKKACSDILKLFGFLFAFFFLFWWSIDPHGLPEGILVIFAIWGWWSYLQWIARQNNINIKQKLFE